MCDNQKFIETTGKVIETLPNTTFKVEIDNEIGRASCRERV